MENETLFFGKSADELIWSNRIRLLLLEPKYFVVENAEYSDFDNETLVLRDKIREVYSIVSSSTDFQ